MHVLISKQYQISPLTYIFCKSQSNEKHVANILEVLKSNLIPPLKCIKTKT